MRIVSTKAVKIEIDNEIRSVSPGEIITIPDDRADRVKPYIEKGLFRPVDLKPGDTIEWTSQIFGKLTGQVKEILGNGVLVVDHPLNDGRYGPATIRAEGVWIVKEGE